MTPPEEDLFGKLDQLISKHQGRARRERPGAPVPILEEFVEIETSASAPDIPVLDQVVETRALGSAGTPRADRRRQMQIALYLRLRQRLDEELEQALAAQGALAGAIPEAAITRLAQALRNALPAIVSESVDQALGPEGPAWRPDWSGDIR